MGELECFEQAVSISSAMAGRLCAFGGDLCWSSQHPGLVTALSQGQNPAVPEVWLQKTHQNWDFCDVFSPGGARQPTRPGAQSTTMQPMAAPSHQNPPVPSRNPVPLRMGSCHHAVIFHPPPGSTSGAVRMKSAPELLRAGSDFTELQCRWINSSAAKSTWLNTGYITVFITVVWIGF